MQTLRKYFGSQTFFKKPIQPYPTYCTYFFILQKSPPFSISPQISPWHQKSSGPEKIFRWDLWLWLTLHRRGMQSKGSFCLELSKWPVGISVRVPNSSSPPKRALFLLHPPLAHDVSSFYVPRRRKLKLRARKRYIKVCFCFTRYSAVSTYIWTGLRHTNERTMDQAQCRKIFKQARLRKSQGCYWTGVYAYYSRLLLIKCCPVYLRV